MDMFIDLFLPSVLLSNKHARISVTMSISCCVPWVEWDGGATFFRGLRIEGTRSASER